MTLLSRTASAVEQHSVDGVREALQSPIPESASEEARQLDDQLLRTGMAMGTDPFGVLTAWRAGFDLAHPMGHGPSRPPGRRAKVASRLTRRCPLATHSRDQLALRALQFPRQPLHTRQRRSAGSPRF
jgi:hypothetical protein